MKIKNYPHWNYPIKRLWLRQARKQWSEFRRSFALSNNNAVTSGCIFYPKPVYEWLNKIRAEMKEMDKIMKDYYKNA
jgi:hypothetical protein